MPRADRPRFKDTHGNKPAKENIVPNHRRLSKPLAFFSFQRTVTNTPRVFFFAQGQFDRKNCSKHLTPKGFSKEISKFQSCQELEKLQVQVHEFLDIFVTCRESRVMQSSFVFSLNKRMKNKGTKLSDTLKKLHSHARVLNFSTVWKLCAKI